MAQTKKKSEHYVNNKEFLAAMVEYKKSVNKAHREKKRKPRVPDYIGGCFLKIANHLSYRPNFINYTFSLNEEEPYDIKNYEIKPISITSNDQANQNRLQIEIYIEFTNSLDPNKSFNENFMRFADYDSNLNFSDIEVELINEIILELIEDIFNKAFAGW